MHVFEPWDHIYISYAFLAHVYRMDVNTWYLSRKALSHGICGKHFKNITFKINTQDSALVNRCEIALRGMIQKLLNEESTWQQSWSRYRTPHDIHYNDVIMATIASQITSLTIVYSTVYSGADQKTSKLRVTGLCDGNSPLTGEFPAQRASNAENVSIDDVIMLLGYNALMCELFQNIFS